MSDLYYKRRFGDRSDGRHIRSLDPRSTLRPFLIRDRSDAANYLHDRLDITEPERWFRQQRERGYPGMSFLHLALAAYVRVVARRPALNRFISGQRIFARHNIEVCLVLKRGEGEAAAGTTIKVRLEPTDTIFDVYRRVAETVSNAIALDISVQDETTLSTFCRMPRPLMMVVLWGVRTLDYFGLLPPRYLEESPFHGSLCITEPGAPGLPPLTRAPYSFGNLPLTLAFGSKYHVMELDGAGLPVERKYIDYTAAMDERICNRFFLAAAFQEIRHFMQNPRLLEVPPERVEEDIF